MDTPFAGGREFTANAGARSAETTPITKTGLILICQYTKHNAEGARYPWAFTTNYFKQWPAAARSPPMG